MTVECRVCGSGNLELALAFPEMPWANNFLTAEQVGKEEYYPLRVVHCANCKTVQLDYTVPKETMFGDHTYCSGTTKTLQEHFMLIAGEVDNLMGAGSILDIGSNDGTQLQCFKDLDWEVLGVESSVQTAKVANDGGIPTLNKFFNEKTAKEIGDKFDVINAAGVFFHLEELHSVCKGIKLLLKDDGVFVVQFIYAKTMMDNGAFDQIYHEHLLYYTCTTIGALLKRHGLKLQDAYLSPIHGGSIIGFVRHENDEGRTVRLLNLLMEEQSSECNELPAWEGFAVRIEEMKQQNLARLHQWKAEGKRVYGMGAPVKGNTLLNTFGITADLIECLVERNPLRKGLYAPGSHIPIKLEDEVGDPDIWFCLAWNFRKEILERYKDSKAEFFFPVECA